jgi:uncharacterized protein YndB with AHSA1/START domain
MATTRVTKHIAAPPGRVYSALTDPDSVQRWMVPDGMTSQVHEFDTREGGTLRISLTYDNPDESGKTHGATDASPADSPSWYRVGRWSRSSSSTPTIRM